MDSYTNQHDARGSVQPIMAFDENASAGTETGESRAQKDPTTSSDLPGLEGLERLVVPSHKSTRSFIPFGIDGISVIISPYGEVLRMSKYIAEEDPRVICLDSPGISQGRRYLNSIGARMQRRARMRKSGLNIRLMANSNVEDPILETRLEWINGRWPCVRYEIDGILVSVLFTVNEGVLSQQFFIENPSSENKAVHFALQIRGANVRTLRVARGQWASLDEYDILPDEPGEPLPRPNASGLYKLVEGKDGISNEPLQQDVDAVTNMLKGEALIAVFHNGELLKLDEKASVPINDPYASDSDDGDGGSPDGDSQSNLDQTIPSASSGVLMVACKGIQKLSLQYELQCHTGAGSRSPEYLDAEIFLKSDQSSNWSFKEDHEFNPIFKRYLEHILCLCMVDVKPDSSKERRIPFLNDVTLERESTPLGDL